MKRPLKMVNGYIKPKTNGFCSKFSKNRVILIAAISSFFAFGALGSSEVQGFTQYVKVNVKNADISLDDSYIALRNYGIDDSKDYRKEVHLSDSTRGSSVYVTNYIPNVSTGDVLQACLHMPARELICDHRKGYYTDNYVNFVLDMDEATPTSSSSRTLR